MNDDFDDVFGLLFFLGPTISMMFLDFTLMLLLSWSVFRLTADDFFFLTDDVDDFDFDLG